MFRFKFLGTAATQPYAARSASAILCQYKNYRLLLDAGQNLVRQCAIYGQSIDVDAIFITHIHGDHIYGLLGLVDTLQKNNRIRQLLIYGPAGIQRFKQVMRALYRDPTYKVRFIVMEPEQTLFMGELEITARKLVHGVTNYGYFFKVLRPPKLDVVKIRAKGLVPGKWCRDLIDKGSSVVNNNVVFLADCIAASAGTLSFMYTGDTKYMPGLLPLGLDLLIHECSYYKDVQRAKLKKHTSYKQLANLPKNVAKKVIITHISQQFHPLTGNVTDARFIVASDGFEYVLG